MGEASIANHLHGLSDHVSIRQQSQHIAANADPAFLAEKLSSMSCVSSVTQPTVDLPCGKPACSLGSNGSMIGSARA